MPVNVLQVGKISGDSTLAAATAANKLKLISVPDETQALEVLNTQRVEMVFVGHNIELPNFFTHVSSSKITAPIVACGPAQPVKNAVTAIRLGAIEYLATPLEQETVEILLSRLAPEEEGFSPIVGDPKTLELLSQAKQFAQSNASILLRGESGTGKEVYSKYIHANSPRSSQEFVAVNCAAIPENLLESELFGHEKGAFSGALNRRIGKFQQADHGTLLLDEISEMDLTLQAKLLRAIQERVIDPVGSSQSVPIDIRLIATTNRHLEDYVAEGSFREDLYFRLNVVMLEIPPLRERPGDIPPLAEHFVAVYGKQNDKKDLTISAEAMKKLENCYWKGNVRELENTLHRAVLMTGSATEMQPEHIVISPMSLQMMEQEDNNQQAAQSAKQHLSPSSSGIAAYAAAETGQFSSQNYASKSLEDIEKEHIINTLG
ncbi:MAG: sigma-54 dependent transcriptional regulator, partial [Alphaproteobacteria bacterium]|nr:sigma-54 dependent transcriptional regulator [Alphaproteobacteria bacterium]